MSTSDSSPLFLSTAKVAGMLGISTTLVQSLVDKNELFGWKTRGGHRRIALQSVIDYQSRSLAKHGDPNRLHTHPKVMVVIETPELLELVQRASSQWAFSLEYTLIDSITVALLELSHQRPDVLIIELSLPRQLQEKTLAALQDFNARGTPVSMTLVTQETGLAGTVSHASNGIQLAHGPLTTSWLQAFLTGVEASWQKRYSIGH